MMSTTVKASVALLGLAALILTAGPLVRSRQAPAEIKAPVGERSGQGMVTADGIAARLHSIMDRFYCCLRTNARDVTTLRSLSAEMDGIASDALALARRIKMPQHELLAQAAYEVKGAITSLANIVGQNPSPDATEQAEVSSRLVDRAMTHLHEAGYPFSPSLKMVPVFSTAENARKQYVEDARFALQAIREVDFREEKAMANAQAVVDAFLSSHPEDLAPRSRECIESAMSCKQSAHRAYMLQDLAFARVMAGQDDGRVAARIHVAGIQAIEHSAQYRVLADDALLRH